MFFAFAGYARIATLGEEVREPARTIPRAIRIALGLTLLVYAAVAVTVLAELGSTTLASATAPLADAVSAAGHPGFAPVVRVGAAVAAVGSLLALILGVSRTTLAMARDRYLPGRWPRCTRFGSPHPPSSRSAWWWRCSPRGRRAGRIGFSSFAVLLYYAIANAAAMTLPGKLIPALGFAGCVVLAFALPATSVLAGAVRRGARRRRVRTSPQTGAQSRKIDRYNCSV